ncbi:hypothetical protein [Paramagnetospirillum magneticum]|uniref:hypothetical protein n=1 Tax=Paramagnetospirillum magneticum TaxID=84159 RepID=UPI0011D14294|nr:hypothetical protein [Paramagnetospirillum magneticum]
MEKNISQPAIGSKSKLPRSWQFFRSVERSKLAFATIIISGIRVSQSASEAEIESKIGAEIELFKSDWASLTKSRRLPGLRFRGAFEFDLSRSRDVHGHRESLFSDMGVQPLVGDDIIINLHVHMLIACSRCDADNLSEELRRKWPGRWRVVVKSLFENQSTDEAVSNIYGYINKQICRYASGGIGDIPVTFGNDWEPVWLKKIGRLYKCMSLEFRSSDRWLYNI